MVAPPTPHSSVLALKQQGDKAYLARDFVSAIEHYSEGLERFEDPVILSNRSASYAQRRQFEKARSDAERALKLQPKWPRLYHRLGHALFHLGQYSEAVQTLERGLKLDPDDKPLSEALGRSKAYTEIDPDAPPQEPYCPWTKWEQPVAAGSTSPTMGASVEQSPEALAATASEAEKLQVVGEWMYGTQNKSYTISQAENGQVRYIGPHSRVGQVSGPLRWQQGQLFEAQLSSDEGEIIGNIRLNVTEPDKTIISNYRAQANTEWGKDIIAHKGAPATAEELREQGNALFRQGKHSMAMKAYSDAISMDAQDAKCFSNRAAAQIAILSGYGNKLSAEQIRKNPYYDLAKSDLEECLTLDPKFIKAYARKGQLLSMGDEVRPALAAYDKGLELDPASEICKEGREFCWKLLWG